MGAEPLDAEGVTFELRPVMSRSRAILPAALLIALPCAIEPASAAPEAKARATRQTVSLKGDPITFSPTVIDEAEHVELPVNLIISADEKTLLATLLHRGWSLHRPLGDHSHSVPEHELRLDGRPPALDLEHAGTQIDERLRLVLWRYPDKPGPKPVRLPVWIASASRVAGVRPLSPPATPPKAVPEVVDRVIADLSFGLAQTRTVSEPGTAHSRLRWVELAEPPDGAEQLVPDVHPALDRPPESPALPPPRPIKERAEGLPRLKPLPPPRTVSAEVISLGPRPQPQVALTFDACSTLDRSFYDERVTRVLRETKTPATLFVSGRWAETHLRQVQELARDPLFEIANHSYMHPHMTEVPEERQREELLWTQQILYSLTDKVPRFFRPPYGELDDPLAHHAAEVGLRTVEYDFPSGDPDQHITKERLIAWVVKKARPGSIVVMHMNRHGWHTAEALPQIIAGLRARKFELVRVGDMVP